MSWEDTPMEVSHAIRWAAYQSGKSGGPGVPEPVGDDAEDVLAKLEQVRSTMVGIAEWAMQEWNTNGFHSKIVAGLATQARMRPDAAQSVARDLIRLLEKINSAALDGATAASLMANKLEVFYIGEIREARSKRNTYRAQGLKVN